MKRVVIDNRRQALIFKTEEEAYAFCAETFIEQAQKAVSARGSFSVALSGGSTPLPVYEQLANPSTALLVNWSLVDIFWGDERCVPATDPESNYGNALSFLSIPPLDQAKKHRLIGDAPDLGKAAADYEKKLKTICSKGCLDMIFLGLGNDGHTASLFPHTKALTESTKLVTPNYLPEKDLWRMSLTFEAINSARSIYALVLGRGKSKILKRIFFDEKNIDELPGQNIGTEEHPAYFILDKKAAYGLGLKC